MRIATAQHPPIGESDDKIYTTSTAVIMLDGASAFVPTSVTPSTYAEHLGAHVCRTLDELPDAELTAALAEAIATTVNQLDLSAEASPSSTVTIARQAGGQLDLLVLGDSLILLPDEVLTDERMDDLDLSSRRQYQERLAAGYGYDDEHERLLRELQTQQAEYRNRDGGYWIAETDPSAAQRAITAQRPLNGTPWVVLATDGAYNTMRHLGHTDWPALAGATREQLHTVLEHCQDWEANEDPHGHALPRAKRHDDKSLAAISLTGR